MKNSFIMPVDALQYNFRLMQVQQVEVRYQTFRGGITGNVFVSISSVSITLDLLRELENTNELIDMIENAARHNAESFWKQQDAQPLMIV